MKSTLAATSLLPLLLQGVSVNALPTTDPVRVLPYNWQYEIAALAGPGCPDFGKPDYDENHDRHTRLTYGANTVDGSEIYYWFIAMPYLRVETGASSSSSSSWCEATIKYTEYKDAKFEVEGADYRLRLHKNGTKAVSVYHLDEGVKATFTFKYLDAEPDIVDSLVLTGPASSGPEYGTESDLTPAAPVPEYKLPACGAGTIKIRSELKIESTGPGGKDAKGTVASESFEDEKGLHYYGTQYGFSYDWEKCKK